MSKKPSIFIALLLILMHSAVFVDAASSEKTNWVSLGSKNGNFGASLGSRTGNTGWEIGFLNTENFLPNKIRHGLIPEEAISLGDKNISGAYGVDILKFFPSEQGFTLYAGAGAYFQDYGEVYKFDNQHYSNDRDTKLKFAYSGGVKFGKPGGLNFGVGYHSVRGANGQVYIKF